MREILRAAALRMTGVLLVAVLVVGCVAVPPEGARQRTPTPLLVVTRVPAPIPWPTVAPWRESQQSRSVTAPVAAVISDTLSAVTNVVCVGDCYTGGGPSWVTSDFVVAWGHEDPLTVDDYELWCAVDEPYFDPDACVGCELIGVTTGLNMTVTGAPPGFNPVFGTEGAALMSGIETCVVRARNAGGTSGASNEVGVVNFSLLQGMPSMQ